MLIPSKQALGVIGKAIMTLPGMVQPKQCVALAPNQVSQTLLAWYESPDSIQIGATPEAFGTTPPAVSYTGTLIDPRGPWVKILTTGGARGTAKFRTYLDGLGVTPVEGSDQTTAATYVIPGTAITVNFPVGTYATNNIYKGVGNPIIDKTANVYNLTNVTSTTRPNIVTVGNIGGLPTWVFDGVNDRQIGPSAMATAVCGGTDNPFMITAFIYVNAVPTGANTACIFTASHTTDINIPLCELRMTANAFQLNRRASAANDKFKASTVLPSIGAHLLIWGFDGTNSWLRDNGVYIIGGDSGVSGGPMSLAAATNFNQFCAAERSIVSGFDEPCSMSLVSLACHTAPLATLTEIQLYENYFL